MSKAAEWKEATVKVLEDLKHRPSKEARAKAAELLDRVKDVLTLGQAERRISELQAAIAKYDRNTGRR